MTDLFDGPGSFIVGKIMARANAGAEAEAIEILAPKPHSAILVIGFGPGVGVDLLARQLPSGQVVGVDPSGAMMRMAARRNRRWITEGRVRLEKCCAADLAGDAPVFDGAIAVNALQLCVPIEATARKLSHIMCLGARLVSVTHAWAAAKHAGTASAWVRQVSDALSDHGFQGIESCAAKAENGQAIMLTAVSAGGGDGTGRQA